VRKQGPPACAETNATAWGPLFRVEEIGGAAKVVAGDPMAERSAKISVQAENLIDVECVGGDYALFLGIATSCFQPLDIFIAAHVRILTVDALASPIGRPVGCIGEKLRGAKS